MEAIDKWVAEFYIRRKSNPRVSSTNLLSSLKLGDSSDSLNLKIASVLREISDSLIHGDLSEGTLDLLETLEKLQGGGSVLTESHKRAYSWTAAECTVRFMWPLSASEGLYRDAVERIWKERIRVLKECGSGLVSQELLKWEVDLDKAVEDPEVYKRIREVNVRYSAVCFLNQLLEEQWGLLGSSCLELVAQRRLKAPSVVQTSLPTNPVGLNVSPLKKKPRRLKRFWTPEEEAALREGVKKYGRSWKDIKDFNPAVFAERTPVDLKDKWRNMIR